MTRRKTLPFIIPILLILSFVAVSWHNASAAYKNEKSVFFGKQGIFVPAGISGLNFRLTKVSPVEFRGAPLEFKRPLLHLEFRNQNGTVNIPYSMTYIIYTLSNTEIKQWEKGDLSIYYKYVLSGGWYLCPTAAIAGALNGRMTTNLTCVAPQSTVYGLGKIK